MSSWKWLGRKMEQEMIAAIASHAGKVREATSLILNVLASKNAENPERVEREARRVEREADTQKQAILETLAKSVMDGHEKAELARLVQAVDHIAAYAVAAASRLAILHRLGGLGEASRRLLSELATLADSSVSLIPAALEKMDEDPMEVINIAGRIEDLEERADMVRARLESMMERECEGKSVAWCIVFHKLIETLEALTDRCEEAADALRVLALVRT